MRLGLDLLFLVPGETGGREAYSRELLHALRASRHDLHVTTFLNRETAQTGSGWWSTDADRAVVLSRSWARRPAAWALGEALALGRAAAAARVDVLHSPANLGSAWGPFARILTLHDLMYRSQTDLATRTARLGTDAVLVPAARRAHRLITATEASRREIVETLAIAPERIAVIAHGAAAPPAAPRAQAAAMRERLQADGRPIALAVGTNVPHKNHAALLTGLAALADDARPRLVIAGHGTDAPELMELARSLGIADDVRLLGAVSADDLEDLYAAANGYLTATLHEGFGLPIVEAMLRSIPVAASDIPVLREVAGEAATWFDPRETRSVADALTRVTAGGPQSERRRTLGKTLAERYTWRATADATAAVYAAARSTTTKTRFV